MVKRRVLFTYTPEVICEPIVHSLGQEFNVVVNIRQAELDEDKGWIVLELDGRDSDIEAAIAWATSRGVRIDPY